MAYYATHRPYGRNVLNVNGLVPDTLHAFEYLADARAWANKDPEHRTLGRDRFGRQAAKRASARVSWTPMDDGIRGHRVLMFQPHTI